jgi:serine/threonine protein kinase
MNNPNNLIGDRYEFGDRLGSGAFSEVFRARDHSLNRDVAQKLFLFLFVF